MPATPSSTIASSRASRISTICANAGRRRCARPMPAFRVRPTRTRPAEPRRTTMAELQKVAVVTGAGAGIGKAVALALLKEGYAVVLAGRRKDKLEETASEGKATGAKSLVVPTDVSDPAAIKALFAKTKETFGRLDV